LKDVPALQPPEKALPATDPISDNSNTQFAILGVWVAGRHGVPTERTLALAARRFRRSQVLDGAWGYKYRASETRTSMTAAGLMALAVGHGLDQGSAEGGPKKVEDAAIQKGFKALSESIGKPLGGLKKGHSLANINLYTLWSIERVGVLFNVRQIEGKDWYHWGAEILVDAQKPDGSWHPTGAGYFGSTPPLDTCFALLFLKRANLVKDLSKKVEFGIDSSK
jgi:hypothetical protein